MNGEINTEPCRRLWCSSLEPCNYDNTALQNNQCLKHIIATSAVLTLMPMFLLYSYCAVKPCGGKLKVYKYTQPLIGTPEPLPETGVLADQNHGFHATVTAILPIHAPETLMLP